MTTIAENRLRLLDSKELITLYSDMIGDLFHLGHVCFLKKAIAMVNERFPNSKIRVVVGLLSDETAEFYKRRPILKLSERAGLVREVKIVDEVIENCPLRTSAEFLDKHKIDLVAHGDDYDAMTKSEYYKDVLKRGALIIVPYSKGISTSNIINRCYTRFISSDKNRSAAAAVKLNEKSRQDKWHKIWERKGKRSVSQIHHINGFNHLSKSQYAEMCEVVLKPVGIKSTDKVIDCGCGAGAFLLEIQKLYDVLNITGVDYSEELVKRAKLNLDGTFFSGSIESMPYLKSNTYDVVINFSVFHYLNDEMMAFNAVKEFIRIVKPGGKIYIGDVNDLDKVDLYHSLRNTTHASAANSSKHTSNENLTTEHLLLRRDFFEKRVAKELGSVKLVDILDHNNLKFAPYYPCAPYRYSIYLEKL